MSTKKTTVQIPDYNKSGSRSGGHLRDTPQPRVRRWPGCPYPREVRVEITSLRGVSFGATHWYLHITEEHNPIWDGADKIWVEPWDDHEGRGFTLPSTAFVERQHAASVACAIVDIMFSDPAKYRIVWGQEESLTRKQWSTRYRKPRDGD